MKKVLVKISSNRSFGFVFFIVFLAISLWPLKSQEDFRLWAFILSLIFLVLGMNSNNYQVVFQGLDTLHIVYIGYLDSDWWESSELKVKKRMAQEKKEIPYVKIGSDSWEMSPKGTQS